MRGTKRWRKAGGDKNDANVLRKNTLIFCHHVFFYFPHFLTNKKKKVGAMRTTANSFKTQTQHSCIGFQACMQLIQLACSITTKLYRQKQKKRQTMSEKTQKQADT